MHKLGVALAFLVIVGALASTYLTAKLITVRNSWVAKAAPFENRHADAVKELRRLEAEQRSLKIEIETAAREWGPGATVATQVANPAQGRLQIDMGTNFGVAEGMLLHGFELQPDGSSLYRGPFAVATAQSGQSALVPAWRLRPGEVQGNGSSPAWRNGDWRWRTQVPSGYTDQFNAQVISFVKADEILLDRTASLRTQERLVTETEEKVALRTAELVGGPQLPQDASLSPEFREGLVAPLLTTEEERNRTLLEIAALREQVRAERAAVLRLQSENLALTQRLPQPAAVVSGREANDAN